jgi:hypothetical protein
MCRRWNWYHNIAGQADSGTPAFLRWLFGRHRRITSPDSFQKSATHRVFLLPHLTQTFHVLLFHPARITTTALEKRRGNEGK